MKIRIYESRGMPILSKVLNKQRYLLATGFHESPAGQTPSAGRSAFDHQQRKRPGKYRGSTPAARRRRPELRGDQERAVICGVESHIPRPLRSLNGFGDAVLVRRVLMN